MNLVDFGRLISSLRKEHEDEDGAPWTQRRLAEECSRAGGYFVFNENIISSIERGKRNPDRDLLLALAAALRLTSSERREFFLAASGVEAADVSRQENQPEKVFSQVVDRMRELYTPATLIDGYCNVLAVNRALLYFLEYPSEYAVPPVTGASPPYEYNLVRFVFSDEGSGRFQQFMGDAYPDFAFLVINMFRTFSLEGRSTPYFQGLFSELRKSRLFRRYWGDIYYREEDPQLSTADIRASSQKWGQMSAFIAIRTAYTVAGDLHLAVFVPADHSTADACDKIMGRSSARTVYSLAPWPDSLARRNRDRASEGD